MSYRYEKITLKGKQSPPANIPDPRFNSPQINTQIRCLQQVNRLQFTKHESH